MSDSPPGYFVNGYLTKLGFTSLPELSLHFLTSCFIIIFFCFLFNFHFVRQAEVLDHSKTPCSNRKDFVPFTKNKTYVLYIRMDHGSDWITWQNVARCLKIWDLDPRGYHKSLWRMWFNENHVLIVGCPASPYCGHKPAEITPVSIQNEEKRILD